MYLHNALNNSKKPTWSQIVTPCMKLYITLHIKKVSFTSNPVDGVIPSEWDGNFTCNDTNILRHYRMNITKSSSAIVMQGDILIDATMVSVRGSFATFFKQFALQTDQVFDHEIFGYNFTKFEMNGIFQSATYSTGVVIIQRDTGAITCPMEMRRRAGGFI